MEAKEKAVQKNITSNRNGLSKSCLKNFIIPKKTSDKGVKLEEYLWALGTDKHQAPEVSGQWAASSGHQLSWGIPTELWASGTTGHSGHQQDHYRALHPYKAPVGSRHQWALGILARHCTPLGTGHHRAPGTGLLTECFADQRDYSDVKQRLNQSCLDKECNLESFCHFDKIEMVHNKDLEEDFVAKRSQLRKEGRQDEEHSNFLVIAKDDVSKICQSGLRTSYSTKKELSIMKELGNPQLGVYLFRYVDIALNYALRYSINIENIIIFRVLLGKVKKIQPPKGKKKVPLDPTPNFDCHISRISPSVKDSVEDQSIGSLIYFYEYNELSKPVDKPRQCLPYAVVKVNYVKRKVVVEYPIASFMNYKPKIIPKGIGRGRPPGNCTRVTRTEDKLIYEHFRKPEKIKQDLLEIKASVDVSSFSACDSSSSTVITSRQIKDPRLTKREQILGKQDREMEYNLKIPTTLILPCTVPENFFPNNSESAFSYSQFMEKVSWKERTLEECVSPFLLCKGNDYSMIGEQGLGNVNQFSKEILASQNTHIGDHTLKTNIRHDSSKSDTNLNTVSAGDLKREERTDYSLSSQLNPFKTQGNEWKSQESETVCISMDNKKQEFIPQLSAYFDTKINLSNQKPESEDYRNTNFNTVSAGDLKREERTNHSLSSPLNSFKTLGKEWKSQESEPVYISMDNRKQELNSQLPVYFDTKISISNQNPESVTSIKAEVDNRGKQRIKLQNNDYTSKIRCKTDYDTSCSKNNYSSLEREHNSDYETGSVLDYTLESVFHRKNYHSDHTSKEDWTENNCEWSRSYQMSEEDCKQRESQAILQYEKYSMTEFPQQTNKQIYSTSERTRNKETKEEYIINKANDSSFIENFSDIDIMYSSHMTSKTEEMRDLGEECSHICKEASLDKILRHNEECPLSKVPPVPCINEQRNLETDGIICTCDFDQVQTWQLEEESEEKIYTPELQILVSENGHVSDQQDIYIFLEERITWEGGQRKETEYNQVTKTGKQVENKPDRLSSMPLDDDLVISSNHYLLQEPEGEEEETKKDFSGLESYAIKDIPAKPLVEVALDQKHITPSKESTCRQFSLKDTNKIVRLPSPLGIVSEWGINGFTATDILPHVLPNTSNQNLESKLEETNLESKLDEKCLLNEYPADSEDMRLTEARDELKYLDLITKISGVLQKADETSSLNILHKQIIVCRNVLPKVIRSFEIKQGCSFEQVLVFKEIVGNAEKNMWAGHKLKSCAIESLIELQIIMETIEFIENKMRHLEGELTFRSLLWYDDSLYSELFGGQSGYQQQSNFFPAFQRRLKYSAFNELQSYHKQLVEVFENTRWQNHSYYSYLKSRREIVECEAALKSSSCFSDFFLSVPYVCGANFGDTLEDLENTRKSTVDLIKVCKSLPGIAFSAEKEDHLWIIMEIIGTKIEFIKTCEEVNMKASLFGLEHIFFDAAKSLAWREKDKFINEDAKQQNLKINECALSTFYGIYEHMVKKLEDGNFCSAPEENVLRNSSEESYNCERRSVQQEANYIRNSLVLHLDIGYINKILDEAQSANVNKLQQLICRCTEHLEILEKCFQILQEENISNVLITKENVLGFMTSATVNAVILKPETVEVYTEMAMIYETVSFLKNSIARKVNKPRFRSLLWFDDSLLPELFRCQERIASFSYRKDSFLNVIESSIAELQDELNVVCDYAETLNSSYAVHLLTRELKELSETRNLLQTSKSSISMCVDFVPYTVSLNYGSTVSELDCNYNQFSLLLEKLMLADTKDLGKMAHVMKIMKTIEHMKFVCTELGKSPLPVVIFQMLKNWRKSCQLKRQDLETHLDPNERHSTKHSISIRGPQSLNTAFDSKAQQKRLATVTSEDDCCTYEEKDYSFHRKKRKVVASLMTTTKKTHEKENSRNPRYKYEINKT